MLNYYNEIPSIYSTQATIKDVTQDVISNLLWGTDVSTTNTSLTSVLASYATNAAMTAALYSYTTSAILATNLSHLQRSHLHGREAALREPRCVPPEHARDA
jgi:hypothetical protein